jgi:ABC-2 type transport system permease protein
MNRRRLIGLMRKEFIQFSRDRALMILVLYTFLEIALCGWGVTMDLRGLPIAVYDGDRTPESRELVTAFERLESFKLVARADSLEGVDRLMEQGQIEFALVILPGFGRDLKAGMAPEVQLVTDGSNSSNAGQALTIAAGLLRDYNAAMVPRLSVESLQGVKNEVRVWYVPDLDFVNFIMPTMLAIAVLALGLLLPAAAITREKEAGTFEQLMVTPTTSAELITAKIVPMMLVKLIGVTVGLFISVWGFGVPLRGSLLLFYATSALMILSSSAIGVLLGTIANNMQQALMLAFFILFPMAFLSGTTVPVSYMPDLLQWLSYLSPLRYFVEILLGIFLKGVGLRIVWPQILALATLGMALLTISTLRLQRSLA